MKETIVDQLDREPLADNQWWYIELWEIAQKLDRLGQWRAIDEADFAALEAAFIKLYNNACNGFLNAGGVP